MLKQCLAIIFICCVVLSAFAGGGRIYGVVVDSEGNPVAGARVEIHREISGYELTAFSTDNGEYAFNDVPPGIYAVDVTFKGVFLGEERAEMMVPLDRLVNFVVDAELVRSVSD